MRHAVRTAAVVVALVLSLSTAQAATFTVTKVADTADGVCDSDCSLREAIIAANAAAGPDTVVVPSGTYLLTIAEPSDEDAGATGDLDITGDLTISGADAATTIVDGNNTTRVFEVVSGSSQPITFSNLTIRNGNSSSFGGGIENNSDATMTVSGCVVTGNLANGFGGGINNNSGGTVVVNNSTVSNNTATGFGGGINNNIDGTLTVTNGIITGNSAGGFAGGGINNNSLGTATVTGSNVSTNSAQNGGGINNNSSGDFTLTDSTVSGNTSTSTSIGGGGILNNSGGSMVITGSTISGSSAAGPGGGINSNSSGDLTITNSTISGNSTADDEDGGGGLYKNSSAAIVLLNVTFIGNSSVLEGRNLQNDSSAGSISLQNTIVANPASAPNCGGFPLTSAGNNLASDGSCNLVGAGDLQNTNPQVGPLAANGGPTQTHALLPGSPAIDAAGGCPPPATDQRGVVRPQGPACDIGSFEFQGGVQTPTPTPTVTPTGAPPTATPTRTPTQVGGAPATIPTLSGPFLVLLALGLAGAGLFVFKRI